jgi:Flp pilus assembly pilin Flp
VLRAYNSLLARLDGESGQTYVEYALILAMIAAIVLAGWANLAGAINAAITSVGNALGA